MAWTNPDVLWDAKPHTIAKIKLLESYLKPWFAIFGRSRPRQDIVYVDGFCGPGEYKNHSDGSPIAAINAANDVLSNLKSGWIAGNIHLVFIDSGKRRINHLNNKLATIKSHPRIRIQTIPKAFLDGLIEVQQRLPHSFGGHHPLFVFIDPFGATGVPFKTVADILSSDCSEVLINLDASKSFKEQCAHVLELYKKKLNSIPNVRYVFSFEMRNKSGLDYFLVFASQHPLGLQKMKEAMKKIDQAGAYQFSDAAHGQSVLFRFDNPEDFASRLFDHFKDCRALWREVEDYVLNETPFVNPKKMLAALEKKALIQVEMKYDQVRSRKNTYPDGEVAAIIFAEGDNV